MIEQPYLLVMTLACYEDGEGRRYLDELWHKDLLKHLDQIRNLTLASPLRGEFPSGKVLEVAPSPNEGTLHYLDLPVCTSTIGTLLSLPRICARLWKAIGEAEIVHANTGGWPISFGWIAIPMAKLRGKFSLTNVESGGWRLGFKRPWRFKSLVFAIAFETGARVIVNLSDIATFTHAGYRDSMLLPIRKARGHIVCASWIDPHNILSTAKAEAIWREKLADPTRPLRPVYAGSLTESKGVLVMLDALKELERRGIPLVLNLYGQGPLLEHCKTAAQGFNGCVKLEVRGSLAYGEPFFEMLQDHDAIIVPSLSDEQPRIIYDSFARALPVIASNTLGIVELVTEALNGKVVPVGNPVALADAIEWASTNREQLRDFGINGLDVASSLTHDQMHARRAELIKAAIKDQAAMSHA
jgi:glycosyltransferase involved in cell wall biosynthesis